MSFFFSIKKIVKIKCINDLRKKTLAFKDIQAGNIGGGQVYVVFIIDLRA